MSFAALAGSAEAAWEVLFLDIPEHCQLCIVE